jgi:uncharacterized protein (TIGR02145 family)
MKKILVLSILIFGLFSVYSQTQITLTFTAKDSISQNPVSLDSVYVKNLTEDCDTLLYGPVPVLSLIANWPVGIDEINANSPEAFILKQNYPNPFKEYTHVSIYRDYEGPMNLMLFDGLGTKVAEYHNEFEKGFHSFMISSSGNKVLILVASDDKNYRSIKIISTGQSSEGSTIRYLGLTHPGEKSVSVNQDNPGFIFYLGNQMMYTAYASGYHDNTIFDDPTSSTLYTFNLILLSIPVIPTVTTVAVTNITQTTATGGGTVTSDGGANVTVRGVCWNTSPNPTTANSYTTDGSGTGTFVSNITGLTANMLYYVRAYATNSVGTAYGNEVTFSTLPNPVLPTVTTTTVTNIAQTTATSGGNVTSDGGTTVTARGVCWNTSPSPTTANSHTTDGNGTGIFVSNLTSLTPNTSYYVRAYATNSVGTSYGNELTFTTLAVTLPTVTTADMTNITQTTATSGGNVTSDGGATVTTRGVCWNTSTNPTTANSHTTDGSGTGTFVSNLTGLTANTLYYVRAYATNSVGTSYGNELTFTTLVLSIPTVTTATVTNITQTTATGGGTVTSDGGATVTARGVCWNTSSNPTTANSHTTDGSGTGTFVSNLTGLTLNTLYYVRAYATNSLGTAYGNEVSFTTLAPGFTCGDIVSYEGKTYNTIQIGTQCWFQENLNVGTKINGSQNQSNNSIIEKYCYNDLESNCDVYGGLYQWNEMMQYSTTPGVQGICPTGWHLPTDAEWTTLTDYLGGAGVAGGKMKEAGTAHWSPPNTGATNSSGFTALPGGSRANNGNFYGFTLNAYFWSSTEYSSAYAWGRDLYYNDEDVDRNYNLKTNGFSVRCVRD